MIKKLKTRFTALATVSMILLMTVLVLIMNIVNLSSVVSEADSVLEVLSLPGAPFSNDTTPPEKPGGETKDFIPKGMSPEVPYESRYFNAVVSSDGEIIESDLSRIVSVDESTSQKYIEEAIAKNKSRGFVERFRFLKTTDGDVTRIVLLDCGRKFDSFLTFLWISIGVGFLGCLTVFIFFLFASGKIVKPIAESYEKQKRFISDAGHEIKTPLTIINANVDLLSVYYDDSEELDDIKQQINRLTELTNNLVLLSKMEESEHTVRKIELPFSDIVNETANSFHALAVSKNIRFTSDIESDISLNGSPDSIRQLISILLENAVKYTPENGTIDIQMKAGKKFRILTVSNTTNDKICEKDLSSVFDRFYRSDTSRNSQTGGHGIGLSIAKAITDVHNGTINATTKSGNDFTITVTLPTT